jgi:transcriptional regulator with XRE-family HTH domain
MQDSLSSSALKGTAILPPGEIVAKRPNQQVVSKKDIGLRIRLLRQQQGLTQVELADRLDMTQSNLSAIERGTRGVTVHQIVRVAKALRASTDEILLTEKAPQSTRRTNKRLLKRLHQLEELPDRDQRLVLRLLEGLLTARQEKPLRRPTKPQAAPARAQKTSKVA